MVKRLCLLVALGVALGAFSAQAEELKSGPQPGDHVGAFVVEKCAGNPNDNVAVGKNLCYRCMLGSKPVIMVFTRKADAKLAKLMKGIDTAVAKNADKKLSSFVNLIGNSDPTALVETAKQFGEKNSFENVALVVPNDSADGPADFKICPDAETTVVIYRNGTVEANHALAAGKLTDEAIAAILADTTKILN